ncbi:MAG: hypothetical protein H7Z21_10965 [Hymenobacter sp.]|nr:hypothetical protein [Hymenobacter sp.]
MSTSTKRTPYLREITTHRPVGAPSSFNRVLDVRMEIGNIAIRDFIVEFAWNEVLAKEDRLEIGATKTVTRANVEIMQAGLGWSKLLPVPGPDTSTIKFWKHFIQFEKRFQVSIALLPVGGEALKALELDNLLLIRIQGILDTHTLVPKIELTSI